MNPSLLIASLRAAFAAHANAENATPMQAYMKSALPFYGIPAPQRRKLTTEAVKNHPCHSTAELAATMLALFRDARFREERYAAVELPRLSAAHRKLVDLSLLPVAEALIRESAWWDLVDDLSAELLQQLLLRHPARDPTRAAPLGPRRRPLAASRSHVVSARPRR